MKQRKVHIFLFFMLKLFGMDAQQVFSVHPLFTEPDAMLLPHPESRWTNADENSFLTMTKAGDNFYWLIDSTRAKTSVYEAMFVSIGRSLILDIAPALRDSDLECGLRRANAATSLFL